IAAYEGFVADSGARTFAARFPGPFWPSALGFLFALVASGFLVSVGRSTRLSLDPEADGLLVEERRYLRPTKRARRKLSTIDAINIDPIDDSDAYDLSV